MNPLAVNDRVEPDRAFNHDDQIYTKRGPQRTA